MAGMGEPKPSSPDSQRDSNAEPRSDDVPVNEPETKPPVLEYGKPIDPIVAGQVWGALPQDAGWIVLFAMIATWAGTATGINLIVEHITRTSLHRDAVRISTAAVLFLLWLWQRQRLKSYAFLALGHWFTRWLFAWGVLSLLALTPLFFFAQSMPVAIIVIVVAFTLAATGWFSWRTREMP